jgi:hypothetical protein
MDRMEILKLAMASCKDGKEALALAREMADFAEGNPPVLIKEAALIPHLPNLAMKLLDWWRNQPILEQHLSAIYQFGPPGLRETAVARKAASILEANGHIVRLPNFTIVDGAPRQFAWKLRASPQKPIHKKTPENANKRWTKDDLQRAATLLDNGASYSAVAKATGRTITAIRHARQDGIFPVKTHTLNEVNRMTGALSAIRGGKALSDETLDLLTRPSP